MDVLDYFWDEMLSIISEFGIKCRFEIIADYMLLVWAKLITLTINSLDFQYPLIYNHRYSLINLVLFLIAFFKLLSTQSSNSKTSHVDFLILIRHLYLTLSLLVFFQPRDMIIIVKCEEELNEGVIDELPSWCSFVRVFLKTKTKAKLKSIKFEKSLGKLKRLTSIWN